MNFKLHDKIEIEVSMDKCRLAERTGKRQKNKSKRPPTPVSFNTKYVIQNIYVIQTTAHFLFQDHCKDKDKRKHRKKRGNGEKRLRKSHKVSKISKKKISQRGFCLLRLALSIPHQDVAYEPLGFDPCKEQEAHTFRYEDQVE